MLGITDLLGGQGVECLNVWLSGHGDAGTDDPGSTEVLRSRMETF